MDSSTPKMKPKVFTKAHFRSLSASVHFAPSTLVSLLFLSTLNILLSQGLSPSDFSAWYLLSQLFPSLFHFILVSAQMSYTQRRSQITLPKVATNRPVPSQSPYSRPLANFTFLYAMKGIYTAIYFFVYTLTRKEPNSLRSQCRTPSRHVINSHWIKEQMDGALGNKSTLRRRLEPDYPDGLNTRLMFLDFILQAINPRLLGEQKKMALLENINTAAGYKMDYRLNI